MNRYSRVFHHISLDDVKRNRLKAEDNRRSFLESVRKAREFLRDLNSPHYSNWRNLSLNENMTTGSVFFTTFPGTGEANLETIDANDASAYTAAGGQDALNGTSIKASGSGEGSDGGFDLGQSYLAFDGTADSRHAILDPIDSTKFDTLVINAIVGNDNNGGEDPDEAGEELRLYYLEPDGDSFKSISVNPAGTQVLSANADVIIDLGAGSGALQQFSISLPSHARGTGFTYMLYQLSNSGQEFDHYGITSIKYQRRNPISLLVSLDSPEATSMIRDGGNLTPAEKKKRLEDMLAASDEYMDTMFPTNQEAMKRAEENLRRNIEISFDPNTFKFPGYGTPTYNQMFNAKVEADSDTAEIERALEQKGLTLDTLSKDVIKNKGQFGMGREATLTLLNNPDTQEKALTALGIDPGLVNNLTPDSFDKIGKITNLRPGGTPATGWDGKFYEMNDPRLEASRVIPLETYLQVKGTDNYAGVERPDRAQPGFRYVMDKPYSFSQDSEARPVYTSVRNKDMEDRSTEVQRRMVVSGGDYDLGLNYYYNRYINGYPGGGSPPRSLNTLRTLMDIVVGRLRYLSDHSAESAYGWYQDNAERNARGEEMLDPKTEYDPLWMFYTEAAKGALELAKGLTSGRDLDSPVSYYTSNTDSPSRKEAAERVHKAKNDNTYNAIQKYLNYFKGTDATVFEEDEWYIWDFNTIAVKTVHPYSGLPEPELTPEEPTPEEPQEPTERDAYNYYPEFDEIEDIPSKITGEDVKMTIDDLGAAGYSAYKAGGGDAKVKEGFTVAQVIKIGQANINAFAPGAPVQKPISNPKTQAPNLYNNVLQSLNELPDDMLPPGTQYRANIATSIIANKPVVAKPTLNDIRLFKKGLNRSFFGEYALHPIVKTPVPYADENIRERPDGTVEINPDPSTNNTAPVADLGIVDKVTLGYTNPIAAAGQAQMQLVVPNNNPNNAYLRYTDHAYANLKSPDPGEFPIPTDSIIARLISGDFMGVKPHTGGFKGYPSNIKGDQITRFDIPYNELPSDIKSLIDLEINTRQAAELGSGTLSKTTDVSATDAASTAADTQKKKKKKVTEMYEPKAKHNEKITKHPKMKSPKEFFKRADIKPVYPDTPPPEMINGRHPDWQDDTKLAKRFSKLDPESARAMPDTGSPQVDALIRAARKKPK